MRNYQRIFICLFLMLCFISSVSAEAWRGIIPLKSTRADVLRILGEPSRFNYIYDLDEGTVKILYARERCEQGVPYGWGNWNVPPDTVINISVEADLPVKDLKIRNLKNTNGIRMIRELLIIA